MTIHELTLLRMAMQDVIDSAEGTQIEWLWHTDEDKANSARLDFCDLVQTRLVKLLQQADQVYDPDHWNPAEGGNSLN